MSVNASRHALLALLLMKADNGNLVQQLIEFKVQFLIIGSSAVAYYGCRDAGDVRDLDILYSPTVENSHRLLNALAAAKVDLEQTAERLARPGLVIPVKTLQYHTDFLTPNADEDFDQLREGSLAVPFRQLTISLISLPNLVRMKERAVADAQAIAQKHLRDLECLRTHI